MIDAFRYTCGATTTFTFWPFFAPRGLAASMNSWAPGWQPPAAEQDSHALLRRIATLAMSPFVSATMPSSSIIYNLNLYGPRQPCCRDFGPREPCSRESTPTRSACSILIFLRPQQLILYAVHKRLPACLDHVLRHADGAPPCLSVA